MLPFALNHMTAPKLGWEPFLDLAKALGCVGVEFRNDLPGKGANLNRLASIARCLAPSVGVGLVRIDDLGPEDLFAPPPAASSREIPFEEAIDIIAEARSLSSLA